MGVTRNAREIAMGSLVELTEFIVSLSENPDQAQRFKEDPAAVIESAGLSKETSRLLLSPLDEFLQRVFAAKPPRPTKPRPLPRSQLFT
jgi:hypothetical protein